jgi:hypothetical protein
MAFGEMVLVEQEGAPAYLANEEVLLADIAEIAGDDTAAIAVVVRAGQVAEVQEVASLDIQPGAFALVAAKVMAILDNLPRVLDPELAERIIDASGRGDLASTITRL